MSEHVKAKELKKLRGHQKLMRRWGEAGGRNTPCLPLLAHRGVTSTGATGTDLSIAPPLHCARTAESALRGYRPRLHTPHP